MMLILIKLLFYYLCSCIIIASNGICCPPLAGQTARGQVEEVANVEKANLLMAAVITVRALLSSKSSDEYQLSFNPSPPALPSANTAQCPATQRYVKILTFKHFYSEAVKNLSTDIILFNSRISSDCGGASERCPVSAGLSNDKFICLRAPRVELHSKYVLKHHKSCMTRRFMHNYQLTISLAARHNNILLKY